MNGVSILELAIAHALQIAALAGSVLFLTRCLGKDRPHLAHTLWALVLLKCLTPPIIASPLSPFSWIANYTWTTGTSEPSPLVQDSAYETKLQFTTSSHQPIAEPPPKPKQSVAPTTGSGTTLVAGWLMAAWGASTLLLSTYFAWRFFRFLTLVRATSVTVPAFIPEEVDRLRGELGIRRPVRVRVLDALIGPAVMGIWRPTLLLPKVIVEAAQPTQLRLLLAHELVHVRRGDLVWSALQVMASSLWWFHPAVWLTNQLLTRESERSCDEETIASLGCQPATYARSLIAVLETRQQLSAAPIVPGLRPVDITLKRMERIMRIGQGSRSRTPRWVVPALIGGAILLLPGAAWLQAQDEAAAKTAANTSSAASPPVVDAPPAIEAMAAAGEPTSRLLRAKLIVMELPVDWLQKVRPADAEPLELNDLVTGGTAESDLGLPGTLILKDGAKLMRGRGTLKNRIAVIPASATQPHAAPAANHATWILDEAALKSVEGWLQGSANPKVKVLNRPLLTMHSGTAANMTVGQETPFIVNVDAKTGQPTVANLFFGVTCKLTATLSSTSQASQPSEDADAPRWVGVDFEFEHAELLRVDEFTLPIANGATARVQQPSIASRKIAFYMNLPWGATVATAVGTKIADGEQRTILCLLSVDPMSPENEHIGTERYTRVPVLGPLTTEKNEVPLEPLSDDEVFAAFERSNETPPVYRMPRGEYRIVKELIADYREAKRFVPLIGVAALHHRHYKCTLYTEGNQAPFGVVYVDHNRFVLADN